ncbi:unnamed protein product [Alopecurus aequalis]
MTADTLIDDIILEILARVPDAPALLRCAATCKWWRGLVADPSFLRRRWPDPTYSLLGSFVPTEFNSGDDVSLILPAADWGDETDYDLHTFVAGQPTWNAPTKCISRAALGILMHSDAVVCQGAAHWLFCASSIFHVLHVDAETGRVSSTKLTNPISPRPHVDRSDLNVQRDRRRLATTTDGKLLSLCLYDASLQLVEIWTQPAAGHGQDWPRTGVIDLKPILEQPQQVPYIWLEGGCGNGKLLIMLEQPHGYIANLQTGTMQAVDNMSSHGSISKGVVCMEIDWTTFFMARLACTNQP